MGLVEISVVRHESPHQDNVMLASVLESARNCIGDDRDHYQHDFLPMIDQVTPIDGHQL